MLQYRRCLNEALVSRQGRKLLERKIGRSPGASEQHLPTPVYIQAFEFSRFVVVVLKSAFDHCNLGFGPISFRVN